MYPPKRVLTEYSINNIKGGTSIPLTPGPFNSLKVPVGRSHTLSSVSFGRHPRLSWDILPWLPHRVTGPVEPVPWIDAPWNRNSRRPPSIIVRRKFHDTSNLFTYTDCMLHDPSSTPPFLCLRQERGDSLKFQVRWVTRAVPLRPNQSMGVQRVDVLPLLSLWLEDY